MSVFFKPSDIVVKQCSVTNVAAGGATFAVCEDGESVFINPKMAGMIGCDIGDLVQAYCIDNHRPEVEGNYNARWRAIKANILEKLIVPEPVVVKEKPKVADLLKRDRLWTTRQLAAATGEDHLRVATFMRGEHSAGRVACLKVYASGEQENASALYYGKSTELIHELIDEIELGE